MSYNTELRSNNTELQEVLNAINELPDLPPPPNNKTYDMDRAVVGNNGNL